MTTPDTTSMENATRKQWLAQNIDRAFVQECMKRKQDVTVFLVNGVKLQGVITFEGPTGFILNREGHNQLVYHHAVSTVMPNKPMAFEV